MWGLISPKSFPFLAHLEAQGGSHSSCLTPARKPRLHSGTVRPPRQEHGTETGSLRHSLLTGTLSPCQKGAAQTQLLTPHPRKCLKPTALPLSPWKRKSTPKGKTKHTNPIQKHPAPFRNNIAGLLSQHNNVLAISNQVTAIVAANEWHCPLDSSSVQHVVFISCLLSGFHSLSFIWPPENNKIIQNLKLTDLTFLASINIHIYKAVDSTKNKISKTRPIISCLACICWVLTQSL